MRTSYAGARWGPPPRILVAASALVLAVCTVLAILGALRTGITTDEPIHVMRLRNYFDTGWYALDWDYTGAPGSDGTNTFVYAPVTMLLLHAWSVLWGVEGWGDVATSSHAYDVRHLGVALIGLVGVAAVGATGRVVLRHWRWGLVAAASLSAIPMWTGHQMFNVKDVPVATGYTLATLGVLLFVRETPTGIRLRLARAGCLAAGLTLTLGTRPGMWPGLLVTLVVAVAGIALSSPTRRTTRVALVELAATCAVSSAVLVASYPRLFGSPLHALPRTTESSSSFLNGEKSDRLYVPRHLAEEMPTLLLAFVLTGALVVLVMTWRHSREYPVSVARVALVGVQVATLPTVAVLMGSDLYHGLRQLLFAAPAAAVLAAYGMAWWHQRIEPSRRRLVAIVGTAALLLPMVDQVTLQPYQTTYVNLATDLGTKPFTDNPPGGDFWRVSIPELIQGMPLDRQLLCKAIVDKKSDLSFPFMNGGEAFSTSRSLDCRNEPNGPLAPLQLPRAATVDDSYDAVFVSRLPTNCTPLNQVARHRHGFKVVLTTLGRCTVDVPVLTAQGVRYDDTAEGSGATDDLWRFAVDGWEQWPGRMLSSPLQKAQVAFQPGGACVTGCTLVIHGAAPTDLKARIDGERVAVSRGARGAVHVPISPAQASRKRGVWLTFTRRSREALGMQLAGLSLRRST